MLSIFDCFATVLIQEDANFRGWGDSVKEENVYVNVVNTFRTLSFSKFFVDKLIITRGNNKLLNIVSFIFIPPLPISQSTPILKV